MTRGNVLLIMYRPMIVWFNYANNLSANENEEYSTLTILWHAKHYCNRKKTIALQWSIYYITLQLSVTGLCELFHQVINAYGEFKKETSEEKKEIERNKNYKNENNEKLIEKLMYIVFVSIIEARKWVIIKFIKMCAIFYYMYTIFESD